MYFYWPYVLLKLGLPASDNGDRNGVQRRQRRLI